MLDFYKKKYTWIVQQVHSTAFQIQPPLGSDWGSKFYRGSTSNIRPKGVGGPPPDEGGLRLSTQIFFWNFEVFRMKFYAIGCFYPATIGSLNLPEELAVFLLSNFDWTCLSGYDTR